MGGACSPSRPQSAALLSSPTNTAEEYGSKDRPSSVQVHLGSNGHGWGRAKYTLGDGPQTANGDWQFVSSVPLASQCRPRRALRQPEKKQSKDSVNWRQGNFSSFGTLPLAASPEYRGVNAAKCKPHPQGLLLQKNTTVRTLRLQALRTSKVVLDQPLR